MSTKKKLENFSKIALLLIFIVFNKPIFSYLSYSAGNLLYSLDKYSIAKNCYLAAAYLSPANKDYAKSYFDTVIKLPFSYEIQKETFDFVQNCPQSPITKKLEERINIFSRVVKKGFGDTYILQTPQGGEILRWDENKFPLKVFIENLDKNYPESLVVKRAFETWTRESEGLITFDYLYDVALADIAVDFNLQRTENQTQTFVAGVTFPDVSNKKILKKMTISLNKEQMARSSKFARNLYLTALHEIGHSLGIMGHSSNADDLMYFNSTCEISQRDVNTLKLLYLLKPNITNVEAKLITTNRKIYAPIILGNKSDNYNEQYFKAISYISKAPQYSAGWVDLAYYYFQVGDNSQALENFEKALSLAGNSEEKARIFYNMSIVSLSEQNYETAKKYIQNALINDNLDEYKAIDAFCDYKKGVDKNAINTLKLLLHNNPKNKDAGLMLADIYCSKYNFIGAILTLKELTKNSPEVRSSGELNKYLWLNLFI